MHDHEHEHEHLPDQPAQARPISPHDDTASRSLADALRWSFRMLTAIMLLVLIGFLLSGFRQVRSQEVGLKQVFGRIVGEAEPGLAYTWPFPVGKIEIVSRLLRTTTIDNFWLNETPEEAAQGDLSKRRPVSQGLRPGWDGAILTGDRGLVHVRLVCTFRVESARKYKENVGPPYETYDQTTKKMRTVDPTRESVDSAVSRAVVLVGGRMTADGIQKNQGRFLDDVRLAAQQELDDLSTGLRIDNLTLGSPVGFTWPLAARPAYESAQAAASRKEALISDARRDAESSLNNAAGANYRALVGELTQTGDLGNPPPSGEGGAIESRNLIGQYAEARVAESAARAKGQAAEIAALAARGEALLARIDEVLVSNSTGGQAAGAISAARSYETAIRQRLEARARRFDDLKTEFLKNRQLMLDREWAQAMEEILDSPTILKTFLNSKEGKTVLILNHDPEYLKERRDWLLKHPPAKREPARAPQPTPAPPPAPPEGPPPGPPGGP